MPAGLLREAAGGAGGGDEGGGWGFEALGQNTTAPSPTLYVESPSSFKNQGLRAGEEKQGNPMRGIQQLPVLNPSFAPYLV